MSSYLLLGQASKSSSSEIYNILDEYFQILNYLRKTEIPITEDISRPKSGTTGIDTITTKEDAIIITSPKISIVKTEEVTVAVVISSSRLLPVKGQMGR